MSRVIEATKPKLLFFHNSLPEYRIAFWKELGRYYNIILIVTDQDLEKKIYGFEIDKKGLEAHYINSINKSELRTSIRKADAVILPAIDRPKELLVSVYIRNICKVERKPYFYWNEKWVPPKDDQPLLKRIKNYIHKNMILYASKGCNCYIASGSRSQEYLQRIGIVKDKIEIAYDSNTSPRPEKSIDIKKQYNISQYSKIILYLGRLVPRKGCRLLIDAVKELEEKETIVLLICGSGEDEAALRTQAGNSENIIFAGKIQPNQRRDYYEQSDLFVLPSYIENGVIEAWGLTINEALECGVPVVSTDAVGAAFDLIDDEVGTVIHEGDKNQLKEAIIQNLNKGINRDICKKKYEEFSVQQMSKRFFEIINGRV